MPVLQEKKDIIAGLKKELIALQGLHSTIHNNEVNKVLGQIKSAFPDQSFPTACIHEFVSDSSDTSATTGFLGILLSALMNKKGVSLWITSNHSIFPPALQSLGIAPDKIIFIFLQNEKQIAWAMEEALKCHGLAGVIGEMKELNFTTSRRLQLAVEKSHVTGFILRTNPGQLNANACVSRWKIKSLPSELPEKMPGVGFPRWEVGLLKIRNGSPGKWHVEFRGGRLRYFEMPISIALPEQKKVV